MFSGCLSSSLVHEFYLQDQALCGKGKIPPHPTPRPQLLETVNVTSVAPELFGKINKLLV